MERPAKYHADLPDDKARLPVQAAGFLFARVKKFC